jgi:hypothetical protein
VLTINLVTCYLLSAACVALVKVATGLRRPFLVYGGAVLGVLCLGFPVSVALSRSYWGYFFRRPSVLAELGSVTEVVRVVPVSTEQTAAGGYRLVANADYSVAEHLAYAREDPYYSLDERMLLHLAERHLLPRETAKSLDDGGLYDLLVETGLLAEPQDGYMSAGLLNGVVVQARTASGAELVFVSATGGQVSNDHYPCYEMVFERQPQSGQLAFVRGQRFFYDVAGMEGAEWYAIWFAISTTGVVLALPIVTLTVSVRNMIRSRRVTVMQASGV